MTRRDVYVLALIAVAGLVAGYWFLFLGPKRSELGKLDKDVAKAEKSLAKAEEEKVQNARARIEFPRAYANVVRLGKSVPVDGDEASLVYQLDQAAKRARVKFPSLKLETDSGGSSAETPAPPAQGGSGGADQGAGGDQEGAQTASSATPAPFEPAGATGLVGTAPADAQVTAALSTGATTGSAGLRVMRFELKFQGSFFRLEDFVRELKRMVVARKGKLVVSGRLVSVDAIKFEEGDRGFPQVKATITATTYLLPAAEGLTAGATPEGPAGATGSAPQAVSGSDGGTGGPPAAAVKP